MSKFLKILAPASAGTASVLTLAYVLADQFVVDMPAPARVSFVAAANAQETEAPAPAAETVAQAAAEAPAPARDGGYGLGREALPEEIAAWDIDIRPDGQGLPVGSGDVWTGEEVFVEKCASCHGDFGEAVGRWPQLAGGQGTLERKDPVKTIGSYWPYLSTVWDYVHRAMPFGDAQSLTPDEVYAITAYLLYLNNIVEDDFELSNESFAEVEMPNAEGFKPDDRPETELTAFSGEACMEGCKDEVEITMRAAVLDVTPGSDEGDADVEDTAIEVEEQAAAQPADAEPAEEAVAGDQPTAPEDAAVAGEADAASVEGADAEAAPAEAVVEASAGPDPELVAAGERVFKKCAACHQVGENAKNRSGPQLNGIVGRTAGTVEGFRYSGALEEAGADGLVWDHESLAGFLADPRAYLKGTKMSFAGLRSDEDIAAITAFLEAQGE
ncbi:sulfur dehydrogenase subunit SoxD [Limimaricola soesokkakensis]|uniref:Cytochrome c2 n=1 Tax=Limimaricola soesokkakensis TaxID=1343159 RepID=A0A1X7A3A3_9RHOB|nr:c-type cytochrome [Limimaricola soesokkakensis]PSK80976.1 sulfur dehydrogenase subunit SoxD [Limimaricola soesokkakensis]SLN69207.1 Cytochrome c2 [Limimaricola soesokkakensis]